MPWITPTLREVRSIVRDQIRGSLPGADANVPNSVLRVLSDNQGALAHLNLQYLDWQRLQYLPDTAEQEFLDRHGDIWLTNSDASTGRKTATLSEGTVNFVGTGDIVMIPIATRMDYRGVSYETTAAVFTAEGGAPVPVPVRALDGGAVGNLEPGTRLTLSQAVEGVEGTVTVVKLDGGADEEDDDNLRIRVLERIREPPQGGAAHDYVRWAKAVPGVTRAWVAPLEMGIGTVTVRFMMDNLRANRDGFPTFEDTVAVANYIDTVRPVAVKDFFVVAPIPQRVDFHIYALNPDTSATRAAVQEALEEMLFNRAKPGQTIYNAWKQQAIMNAPGVVSFSSTIAADDTMISPGHMAVMGDIVYA
jgi:uncharacterized phage protein gp47/JayE